MRIHCIITIHSVCLYVCSVQRRWYSLMMAHQVIVYFVTSYHSLLSAHMTPSTADPVVGRKRNKFQCLLVHPLHITHHREF